MNAAEADVHVDRINNDPEYRERWFSTLAKTVAVDFDGVLHPYSRGWQGFVPDDEPPMPGAEAFLAQLRDEGFLITIMSTRCDTPQGENATVAWLEKHGLMKYISNVTCKKVAAVAYVDDRAVAFKGIFHDCLLEVRALAGGRAHGAGAR